MQEEAEQVTRKLRKLWVKYTKAQGELDGAWGEWAGEKEEMLDSVRMLQQQLTLKDLVIQAFVPPEDVQKVLTVHHPSASTSHPLMGTPPPGPLCSPCRWPPIVVHAPVDLVETNQYDSQFDCVLLVGSSGVLRSSVTTDDRFEHSHLRQPRNHGYCVHTYTHTHVHKRISTP